MTQILPTLVFFLLLILSIFWQVLRRTQRGNVKHFHSRVKEIASHHTYEPNLRVFDSNDFISSWVLRGHEWEAELCEKMSAVYEPGTDFVDAGANLGLNTLSVHRRVPITGTAYLFEPQADVFTLLKHNTRSLPSCKVYNMALWNEPSCVKFEQVYTNIGGTSLFASSESDSLAKQTNYVAALTLDIVIPPGSKRVSVLKIDVEGSECQVLEGARQLLQRDSPIIFIEMWASKLAESRDVLRQLGYTRIEHLGGDDYVCRKQ